MDGCNPAGSGGGEKSTQKERNPGEKRVASRGRRPPKAAGQKHKGKGQRRGGARKAEGNKDDNSIQFNVGKNGK